VCTCACCNEFNHNVNVYHFTWNKIYVKAKKVLALRNGKKLFANGQNIYFFSIIELKIEYCFAGGVAQTENLFQPNE